MNTYSTSDIGEQLAEFETPFADNVLQKEFKEGESFSPAYDRFLTEPESPFSPTYETTNAGQSSNPAAGEFVQLLAELHDTEFPTALYELASELEDSWSSKISNEVAMGDRFVPFATREANEYFAPLAFETEKMIDRVSEYFSGANIADHSEAEMERFFTELEFNHPEFSPAQEQFFGSIFNKVKSVVSAGVNLAKKGISAIGKILPVNILLNKLKGLIKPLLDKVLKFAIGKLPKNLQPYAQTLAKKFLNLETPNDSQSEDNEIPATGNLEAVQTEFDNHLANLVFAGNDTQAEDFVMNYESSSDALQREINYETSGLNLPSLDAAREQFINDLRALSQGESPAPAIERFLPVAIMALKPLIKMGLSIIGRQKVINFLAGLLAKLVGRYVPSNIAQPLAANIIDVGMSAIGFETFENGKPDLAYEAITNTIQETVQNMGSLSEETLNNNEALTASVLEAFESAAADNFPANYIKEELRPSAQHGSWVMMPRNGPKHSYKKFTRIFQVTIDPRVAATVNTFRGVPLSTYLKDKLGVDISKPIQARVHLYEAIPGTKLSRIAHFEKVQGLGPSVRHGYKLIHPLSVQAASLLLKEPLLGRDFPINYTTRHYHTAVGQRFYYLEINGLRLRITSTVNRTHKHSEGAGGNASPGGAPATANITTAVANSSDVQCVINFLKSEIKLNYYFSEEEAKKVVENLNRNDYIQTTIELGRSINNVLSGILLKNVTSKVKIIHEAFPQMFFENVENESGMNGLGKDILVKVIEKVIEQITNVAGAALKTYFKERANDFKNAQAQPQDGVTVKIIWTNLQGMATLKSLFDAINGKLSLGSLSQLSVPRFHTPQVQVSAGRNFD